MPKWNPTNIVAKVHVERQPGGLVEKVYAERALGLRSAKFGGELELLGDASEQRMRQLPLLKVALGAAPRTTEGSVVETEPSIPLRPLVRRAIQTFDMTGARFAIGFVSGFGVCAELTDKALLAIFAGTAGGTLVVIWKAVLRRI